jgi:predicted aminopeptidase
MRRIAPLLCAAALLLSGCATSVGYLAKQGGYLLRTSTGTRGIQAVLDDPSTTAGTREMLLRVQEIKTFATTAIGLKDDGNYTRYKRVDGDHLVDVVSACDAVSFTAYMWRYPFLGKLPYKGFYERADAVKEAQRLKAEGWDVIVRPVDAFSTLGFTKVPLYSFMERYDAFALASTLIHEQAHATLFMKGQSGFNEEFASFVGDEGALEWIALTRGRDSTEYRQAVDSQADQARFMALLQSLAAELEAVYAGALSREEKLARKAEIIADFKERLRGDLGEGFRTEGYRNLGDLPLDNAYLSLYRLYTDDVPLLRSYWEKACGSDLHTFVEAAGRLARKGDVKTLMAAELAGG